MPTLSGSGKFRAFPASPNRQTKTIRSALLAAQAREEKFADAANQMKTTARLAGNLIFHGQSVSAALFSRGKWGLDYSRR